MEQKTPTEIDITGIDRAALIVALHAASPLSSGGLTPALLARIACPVVTETEVRELISSWESRFPGKPVSIDYLHGVPIKGDFSATTWKRPDLYDRDAGAGTAERVLESLRKPERTKP